MHTVSNISARGIRTGTQHTYIRISICINAWDVAYLSSLRVTCDRISDRSWNVEYRDGLDVELR